mmetsp:Transcript_435/g.647  ORF Transcript_435/g.647 Transcript_435/m.647 type:complete len:339 (-) Transcript_435:124-1140(-)
MRTNVNCSSNLWLMHCIESITVVSCTTNGWEDSFAYLVCVQFLIRNATNLWLRVVNNRYFCRASGGIPAPICCPKIDCFTAQKIHFTVNCDVLFCVKFRAVVCCCANRGSYCFTVFIYVNLQVILASHFRISCIHYKNRTLTSGGVTSLVSCSKTNRCYPKIDNSILRGELIRGRLGDTIISGRYFNICNSCLALTICRYLDVVNTSYIWSSFIYHFKGNLATVVVAIGILGNVRHLCFTYSRPSGKCFRSLGFSDNSAVVVHTPQYIWKNSLAIFICNYSLVTDTIHCWGYIISNGQFGCARSCIIAFVSCKVFDNDRVTGRYLQILYRISPCNRAL